MYKRSSAQAGMWVGDTHCFFVANESPYIVSTGEGNSEKDIQMWSSTESQKYWTSFQTIAEDAVRSNQVYQSPMTDR